MPVFPDVGSTRIVRPGAISPSRSAAISMAAPIRSFTEPSGLKNSSFSIRSASRPSFCVRRGTRTKGVPPIVSTMLS